MNRRFFFNVPAEGSFQTDIRNTCKSLHWAQWQRSDQSHACTGTLHTQITLWCEWHFQGLNVFITSYLIIIISFEYCSKTLKLTDKLILSIDYIIDGCRSIRENKEQIEMFSFWTTLVATRVSRQQNLRGALECTVTSQLAVQNLKILILSFFNFLILF